MHWSNKLLKRGNLPALRYGNLPLRKALARATGKTERSEGESGCESLTTQEGAQRIAPVGGKSQRPGGEGASLPVAWGWGRVLTARAVDPATPARKSRAVPALLGLGC